MRPLCHLLLAFLLVGRICADAVTVSTEAEPEGSQPVPGPVAKTLAGDLPVMSPVANLFVHPLIAFPERAFIPGKDESRMDEWFITVGEFEKVLESLDRKGYILVKPSEVFEITPSGVQIRSLDLPAGKKPLILSMDDLNYYPYMRANGTVSRLRVDDRGILWARTVMPGGVVRDDLDREVPQVLEQFLLSHPDFSFHGARGLIALTGYNGILGWPTQQSPGPALREAEQEAKRVLATLKALGWEFASHSYAHRSKRVQKFEAWSVSEDRWTAEVAPLVGATPFYVFPFGEPWWKDQDRWEAMKAAGFRVFFGVEPDSNLRWKDNLPILGRVPLDGRGLRHKFAKLNVFLDPRLVWDPSRPASMIYH